MSLGALSRYLKDMQMSYNVEVYFQDQWIATLYDIPGDSEQEAQQYVEENYPLDYVAEEND